MPDAASTGRPRPPCSALLLLRPNATEQKPRVFSSSNVCSKLRFLTFHTRTLGSSWSPADASTSSSLVPTPNARLVMYSQAPLLPSVYSHSRVDPSCNLMPVVQPTATSRPSVEKAQQQIASVYG